MEGKRVLPLSNIRNKEMGKNTAAIQLLDKVYFSVIIFLGSFMPSILAFCLICFNDLLLCYIS